MSHYSLKTLLILPEMTSRTDCLLVPLYIPPINRCHCNGMVLFTSPLNHEYQQNMPFDSESFLDLGCHSNNNNHLVKRLAYFHFTFVNKHYTGVCKLKKKHVLWVIQNETETLGQCCKSLLTQHPLLLLAT